MGKQNGIFWSNRVIGWNARWRFNTRMQHATEDYQRNTGAGASFRNSFSSNHSFTRLRFVSWQFRIALRSTFFLPVFSGIQQGFLVAWYFSWFSGAFPYRVPLLILQAGHHGMERKRERFAFFKGGHTLHAYLPLLYMYWNLITDKFLK